jgi:ribosomal protein S18 acetylase RimI-like enzyme
MISLRRWGWWKPAVKTPTESGVATEGSRAQTGASLSVKSTRTAPAGRANASRAMPQPVLRWIAQGRVALRAFDFDSDAETVCSFQPETYTLNFPDFVYTSNFAAAFRHDLRRAVLDPHNALFVLDDGREKNNVIGFLWIVICQNSWTQERFGYVNNIFVVPQRRGSGLGKELMRQADEWLRARGVKRLRLTVTATNSSAVSLYQKSGFRLQRYEMEKEL